MPLGSFEKYKRCSTAPRMCPSGFPASQGPLRRLLVRRILLPLTPGPPPTLLQDGLVLVYIDEGTLMTDSGANATYGEQQSVQGSCCRVPDNLTWDLSPSPSTTSDKCRVNATRQAQCFMPHEALPACPLCRPAGPLHLHAACAAGGAAGGGGACWPGGGAAVRGGLPRHFWLQHLLLVPSPRGMQHQPD